LPPPPPAVFLQLAARLTILFNSCAFGFLTFFRHFFFSSCRLFYILSREVSNCPLPSLVIAGQKPVINIHAGVPEELFRAILPACFLPLLYECFITVVPQSSPAVIPSRPTIPTDGSKPDVTVYFPGCVPDGSWRVFRVWTCLTMLPNPPILLSLVMVALSISPVPPYKLKTRC